MENSILYGLVQFEVLFKGTTIASFVVWQRITTVICRNRVTRAAVKVAIWDLKVNIYRLCRRGCQRVSGYFITWIHSLNCVESVLGLGLEGITT